MKRYGNLYDKIISMENLILAEKNARKGKTKTYGVRVFDRDPMGNLQRLHDTLVARRYKTSEYTVFTVHEPKERIIYRLPYYPDRIMHHAIMNICGEIWRRTFTHNTYSCIKGRGISACAKQVKRIIRKYDGKPLYCLKIDIRKFYPSIDHDVLKGIIRKKIKCKDTLALLDEIIDSCEGLPIGNYISQYLANLILAYLMHECNEEWKVDAVEYADDIAFFSTDKEILHSLLHNNIIPALQRLRLTIKDNWQIFPIAHNREDKHGRALDYIGNKFFRSQTLLRKSIKQNLCRQVARMWRFAKTDRDRIIALAPWKGWILHTKSRNLIHKLNINFIAI